jgi:hypothetical protein
MFKRFGLTTMALAAALALFTPAIASARDRRDYHDRYRREHFARGYWGRDGCWHRY